MAIGFLVTFVIKAQFVQMASLSLGGSKHHAFYGIEMIFYSCLALCFNPGETLRSMESASDL